MFGSRIVLSSYSAPKWANEILDYYLPPSSWKEGDWKISWNIVKSRRDVKSWTPYGCCCRERKIIECFVANNDQVAENESLLLHEIAHALQGKSERPMGRRNYIHHDENFFRIAAKLYLDYDISVLEYSINTEYRSGRYVMEAAFKDSKGFGADPMNFPIVKPKRTRRTFSIVASNMFKIGDAVRFFSSKRQGYVMGEVIKVGYSRYKIKEFERSYRPIWTVPFHMVSKYEEVVAASNRNNKE